MESSALLHLYWLYLYRLFTRHLNMECFESAVPAIFLSYAPTFFVNKLCFYVYWIVVRFTLVYTFTRVYLTVPNSNEVTVCHATLTVYMFISSNLINQDNYNCSLCNVKDVWALHNKDVASLYLCVCNFGNIIGLLNLYWWILARVGCKNARACLWILEIKKTYMF